jgi:hypothetical protein
MIGKFSQNDLLVLFRLLAAYIMAEWFFHQVLYKIERYKKMGKWCQRGLKGIAISILTYIWAWYWKSIWLPVAIFIARLVIEVLRDRKKKTILYLTLIPVVYIIVLTGCWLVLINVDIADVTLSLKTIFSDVKLWTVALAYIVLIWPIGVWIGKITEPWREQLGESDYKGLEKAGMWMGRLERILILTFMLMNQYSVIGFLITAKSIFRFREIKASQDRKEAEYILIGTMFSFTAAILIGIFTDWVLK